MPAQLIKIIATKQPTRHHELRRFWVGIRQIVELGNGVGFYPLFTVNAKGIDLNLVYFDDKKVKQVDIKAGWWVHECLMKTGVKVLPMAVRFDADGKPEAMFFEVASINDQVEFFKKIG